MEKSEIIEGNKLIAEFMGALMPKEKGIFKHRIGDSLPGMDGCRIGNIQKKNIVK